MSTLSADTTPGLPGYDHAKGLAALKRLTDHFVSAGFEHSPADSLPPQSISTGRIGTELRVFDRWARDADGVIQQETRTILVQWCADTILWVQAFNQMDAKVWTMPDRS